MAHGDDGHDFELRLLEVLTSTHATVAGDVVQIGVHAWAVHGSIPVDGEVLLAVDDDAEEAHAVLTRLAPDPLAVDT